MAIAVAVLATLYFIGWIIYKAVKDKPIKAHFVSYGVAVITGVFAYAYFLSIDLTQLIKVVVSIVLGIVLIIVAALYQRRREARS